MEHTITERDVWISDTTAYITNDTDQTMRLVYAIACGASEDGCNHTIAGHWDPKTYEDVPPKPGEAGRSSLRAIARGGLEAGMVIIPGRGSSIM